MTWPPPCPATTDTDMIYLDRDQNYVWSTGLPPLDAQPVDLTIPCSKYAGHGGPHEASLPNPHGDFRPTITLAWETP